MKMETVVGAPVAGVVERLVVTVGDTMAAGDVLCVVTPRAAATGWARLVGEPGRYSGLGQDRVELERPGGQRRGRWSVPVRVHRG